MELKQKKGVLLYTDHNSIQNILDSKNTVANQMATALSEVEKLLERKMSQSEKELVLMERWPGVLKLVRDKAGFPKADETSLFGLLGLDPSICKSAVEAIKMPFYSDQFEISNNNVHIKPEFVKATEKANTYYADSERKKEAFKIAQDLATVLNSAIDHSLISKLDHPANVSLNHGHDWKTPLKGLVTVSNGEVVPNVEEISRLK